LEDSKDLAIKIHPSIDGGITSGNSDFSGGTLTCHCTESPVIVQITTQTAHNHVCGCSKCWKPDRAIFSQISVVGKDHVKVIENSDKLDVIDTEAAI
jgi:S-(hydroxymethyl)glutathione synthase